MEQHKAYTDLLCRHRTLVWRMCWLYAGGNVERCRDLVQEVSLSLWQHYGKLRQGAKPWEERAWVKWHTRTVLNHLHRRPQPVMEPLTDELAEHPASDEKAESELVEELLECLPDIDRRLVLLRLDGYNADEIAQAAGLSRDTVYQRLHRIVNKLREINKDERDRNT